MKRIYDYSKVYDAKYLRGYEYNGYIIEIEEEQRRYSMFSTKKWYVITLKNGEKWCSDILREVKEKIDKDMVEVR